MTLSAEEAELNSLINQHWAASSVLSIPETKPSNLVLWPIKLVDARNAGIILQARSMKAPRLVSVNGSKLHTIPDAPYPLSYEQIVLDSDICDRITLKKLCRNGITLHDFGNNPPDTVLDIGTGAGSWIIEAAETWKHASSLVGFDLVEIQPPLSLNGPLASLHGRIRWVQGNALERLPFDPNQFDFVRICRIALGVPETKWNHLLEEALRVLKPNGIFEIIEEDIIFPCRQSSEDYIPPLDTSSRSTAPSTSLHGDQESSGSSAADHSMIPLSKVSSRRPISIMVPKTLSSRTRSRSLGSQSSNASANVAAIKSAIANAPVSAMPQQINSLPVLSTLESEKLGIPLRDPLDHSILNTAWYAMLDDKFISPKPTSLLSFYLSFHFQSIRSHEPIQVIAPQPSYVAKHRRHIPPYLEEGPYEIHLTPLDAAPSAHSRGSGIFTTREAAMHLRRCLQVVLGCREALWEQVKKTYPVMPREYFNYILHDFELDMLDRIDTRSALKSSIGWDAQLDTSDLVKWRERVAKFPRDELDPPLICRTIRGFVGTKASS